MEIILSKFISLHYFYGKILFAETFTWRSSIKNSFHKMRFSLKLSKMGGNKISNWGEITTRKLWLQVSAAIRNSIVHTLVKF